MDLSTGVCLLFVEDNSDDARFVERLLTEHQAIGHDEGNESAIEIESIERADDLATGLERVEDASTDVVLLDLGLPDSSGLETLDAMIEHAPTVPVVVLTGRTGVGIDAIRGGAQDYLVKSRITADVLFRTIRYAIERERFTRELHDRNLRLAVANEILRSDLRNDVSMIVGLGDQLENRVDPADRELVHSLLDASEHLLALTDTVADLMDVISGDPSARRQTIDLRAVLESALERVRAEDDVELTVDWHIPPDASLSVAGTPMLGSVFEHLLTNAITHTNRETARIEVTTEATNDDVLVSIADDGVGIPDDQKAAIVDSSANDRITMGAGMYFVTTVLERIDATIEIEDNYPRGTVVTITLHRIGGLSA